ncbi:MAG: hypothetical protein FRX49_11152 [Trebouxia sp. A1-2]|nr:MAG: hypothetical protein FRX49_11152 [Trebouxia sp. A1-2]
MCIVLLFRAVIEGVVMLGSALLHHPPKAFSALSEAVKYKRDSWQTWSNYGQAAAQTGTGLPAARAVRKASSSL